METYDLIIVGTGFASSFFLFEYLKHRPTDRILVLERGKHESHRWKIENRHLMDPSGVTSEIPFRSTYRNTTPAKPWIYTPSVGGSSNCWFGCTPRFMPADFKLRSTYGVGADWPLTYDELESYYAEAEQIMSISGPAESPYPRSSPYPQPPHHMNDFDRAMIKAFPGQYFTQPAARPTRPTAKRPRCCGSMVCNLCPVDAKFTILNELFHLYELQNVTLRTEATVVGLRIEGSVCKAVTVRQKDGETEFGANLFALGANPIFNAHILLNSGLRHPWLGQGLTEQAAFSCTLDLHDIENFSGSTIGTGYGYMRYEGEHRRDYSACLVENLNFPKLRFEPGKYRQRAFMKFIFEDIPSSNGRISLTEDRSLPQVEFKGFSEYLLRGVAKIQSELGSLFSHLPVERCDVHDIHPTEGHSMGSVRMGADPESSVVDDRQMLHAVRNVLSMGGSSFATVSPANPTLTICALSLRSARMLLT